MEIEMDPRTTANSRGDRQSVWAYLSVDKNGEGVIAGIFEPFGVVQLITAKEKVARQMRVSAEEVAKTFGLEVRLVRFDRAEVVEVIKGATKS